MATVWRYPSSIVLVALALFVGSSAVAQSGDAVTPIEPESCPHDLSYWAEQTSLPIDSLRVGESVATSAEMLALLQITHPDGPQALPTLTRLVQQWLAYRLNGELGFTTNVETQIVAADTETLLASRFDGLPTPELLSDDGEDDAVQDYLLAVLTAYNDCDTPAF